MEKTDVMVLISARSIAEHLDKTRAFIVGAGLEIGWFNENDKRLFDKCNFVIQTIGTKYNDQLSR